MQPASAIQSRGRLWILAGILFSLCVLKALYNPYPVGRFAQDGGYYFQIARHIAAGDGLQTSVSTNNQGIKKLPFTSSAYPLWPVVLGGAGSIIGLERAATAVPEILFVISLVLLYFLGNAVSASWGDSTVLRLGFICIDVGHLVVLLFGLNATYFRFTSLPYTEALAFTMLFATLLAMRKAALGDPLIWGAVAGFLAALSYLSRYQSLGMVVLIPAALLLAGIRHPRYRWAAAAAAVTALAPTVAWLAYLSSRYGVFNLTMLVDFAGARQTPELDPFEFIVKTKPLSVFLLDRIQGAVKVAFHPRNSLSYYQSFGPVIYVVPVVLLYLLIRPAWIKRSFRGLMEPRHLVLVATVGAAAFSMAQVHAMHANRFGGWFFQFRQGLPLILALVPAVGFLLTSAWFVRFGVLALVAASVLYMTVHLRREFSRLPSYSGPSPSQIALNEWIQRQPVAPVFVTTRPYVFGGVTTGLFHGVSCNETPRQMETYFGLDGVSHLLTRRSDVDCPYFTGVKQELQPVESFGTGDDEITIWQVQTRHSIAR